MPSLKRFEGYLLIDNRNSPGVSPDFIRQSGKDVPIVTEGKLYESATMTCAHCNTIVILNPNRSRARGYCSRCDKYVCDTPGCSKECNSFDKFLDKIQESLFHSTNFLIK